MANPNIAALTTVKGKTVGVAALLAATDLVSAVGSDKVLKINSILVSNVDGTNSADISVFMDNDSGVDEDIYLAKSITVPAKSTLTVLSKETPIYLQEGKRIAVIASSLGDLQAICSYEEIS